MVPSELLDQKRRHYNPRLYQAKTNQSQGGGENITRKHSSSFESRVTQRVDLDTRSGTSLEHLVRKTSTADL